MVRSLTQTLLAVLALAPAFAQSSATVDTYITKAIEEWNVPGVSVAVVKDDKVVFLKGYGVREAGKRDPVGDRTLFAIGSTTKAFTSTIVAMLVDDGKLKWDDPVTQHLQTFKLYDPWVTREITIRDLLSHRTGFSGVDLFWYGTGLGQAELLRRIRYLKPNSSFRSKYGYSNVMYLAAGQVAAHAAGMSWDDLVRQRIFDALGMNDSNTSLTLLEKKSDVAMPHEEGKPVPYRSVDNVAPAGAINSNARDMAEWLRFLLSGGSYKGRELVKRAMLAETMTPQTSMPISAESPLFPDQFFRAYALGWVVENHLGRKLVWHNGGVQGMKSIVALLPDERLGVVVLANANVPIADALGYWLIDTWMQAPKDWSALWLAEHQESRAKAKAARKEREDARVDNTSPSLPLDKFVGVYHDDLFGDVKITLSGDRLVFSGHPLLAGELEHWHYNTFHTTGSVTGAQGFATFNLDSLGRVTSVNVENLTRFERIRD